MGNKLNSWLDVCRACAILLVLLSHGRIFLTPAFPEAQLLKFGGFLGVELFFVLSGFLIGRILFEKMNNANSATSWVMGFWGRRWMRTYPSYVLFVILNILIITTIRPDIFPNLFSFLTFTQSLLTPHPSFFGEAWSLAVEEVFYFVTPVLLSLLYIITKNKKFSIAVTILLLISIPLALRIHASIFTSMTFNEIRSTALYRVDSIMIGVISVILFNKYGTNTLTKIGVLLIPLCVYIASMPDSFMDKSMTLKIFLFPMANLGFACLICSWYYVNINSSIMRYLSKVARWSYAAYLTNLPVLCSIGYFLKRPESLTECLFQWTLFISITLFSAWFVYSIFERKVLSLRDKFIPR